MPRFSKHRRFFTLAAVLTPLVTLFGYAALRSGPLAPIPVTITEVKAQSIAPGIFGVGTVEARYVYRIGPTATGRLLKVLVHTGDVVKAGAILGEMDPVELDDRILAQRAAIQRAEALIRSAEAQVREASATKSYAQEQKSRYEELLKSQVGTRDAVDGKRREFQVAKENVSAAEAGLNASRLETVRLKADLEALIQQRSRLTLIAPVDGLVTARDADPGTTIMAGQPVVEMVDPGSLWINVRFDQLRTSGIRPDLAAEIRLRSRPDQPVAGRVLWVEPIADPVTEELLAKVVFETIPAPLPPIGELAEVTIQLQEMAPAPAVPNASVQRVNGKIGVWVVDGEKLRFSPVELGAVDLEGLAQIRSGVKTGERVVVYSKRALSADSRIRIVQSQEGKPL